MEIVHLWWYIHCCRNGVQPLRRMSAWWKRHSGGSANRQQEDQQLENVPSNSNAVSNNVYMTSASGGSENKKDVQVAEAVIYYKNLSKKEVELKDRPPSWSAPPPWRIGAPSYGESWIRPWWYLWGCPPPDPLLMHLSKKKAATDRKCISTSPVQKEVHLICINTFNIVKALIFIT